MRPGGCRVRNPVVFCADVGSVKTGRFGWARGQQGGYGSLRGESMDDLVAAVARDLNAGSLVALRFECPLFVPLRDRPRDLTNGRQGEGNRPWSAGAGAASLAIGLPQVAWVLREIRAQVAEELPAWVRWESAAEGPTGLFLWEAFVSSNAKATGALSGLHALDAQIAVEAFLKALPDVEAANAIQEDDVHSLIGAALLRTEWTRDVGVLGESCLVIRA